MNRTPFSHVIDSCTVSTTSAPAMRECVVAELDRTGALSASVVGGAPVYPDVYAALFLSVRPSGEYVTKDAGGALVLGPSPSVFRFVASGTKYTIRSGETDVTRRADGTLGAGPGAAFAFEVAGTGSPTELRCVSVGLRGKALCAGTGELLVDVERPNGLSIDVKLSSSDVSVLEYAARTGSVDATNNARCCSRITGACQLENRQRYPVCCFECVDADKECAWRAPVDASVATADGCCETNAGMLPYAPDYTWCGTSLSELSQSQYPLCDPTPEHCFAFVPAGVWHLAPSGVTLPAYGRAALMRPSGAGYRGASCRTSS
jgi:hypothetical protein